MAKSVTGAGRTVTQERPAERLDEIEELVTSASPDAEASEPAEEDAAEVRRPTRRTRRRVVVLGALVAATVVLQTVAAVLGTDVLRKTSEDAARGEAVAAARQGIVNLLTISPKTLDADIGRLLDGATGEFKSDFSGQRDHFTSTVKKQNVRSSGEIRAAGAESFDGAQATVLIAADATVKNSDAPRGEPRAYRFRVTVKHIDDRWLVSRVEFVP